jgi:ribosomal protein S18 acetylase RimI-like enzyme
MIRSRARASHDLQYGRAFLGFLILYMTISSSSLTISPVHVSALVSPLRSRAIYRHQLSQRTIASPSLSATSVDTTTTDTNTKIPFIIDEIPQLASDKIYQDVSSMCIEAFFNDGPPGRPATPWKSFQLDSLRRMQQVDLKMRRKSHADTNFMLIARRVVPADSKTAMHTPLLLNLNRVVHAQHLLSTSSSSSSDNNSEPDFVRADVLGFVEVTQRPYGLGNEDLANDVKHRNDKYHRKRPVLTNLSVAYGARQSGVGSMLLQRCEQEVVRRWNMPEMVLEVEDDNENALAFYEKRGYKILFEDPTCRKYDVEGLWLRQVRRKRKIFRKDLTVNPFTIPAVEAHSFAQNFGGRVMQRIRDRVFSTV